MNTVARRHDPFWGLDGRSARRERIFRRALLVVVVGLAAGLLAMMLLRTLTLDAHALVAGHRTVLVGALLADVAACLLLVAGRLRAPEDA
ncbi:MAG TPA: hypothetical protein VFS32_13880 [Candidatus Limnocylindrales bacterium]|nr:hypothetical protein [Candidatus Limnocylindrales bacterium]